MGFSIDTDDFKYIKNLRTYLLNSGECQKVGEIDFLNDLLDKNLISRIYIKKHVFGVNYGIYCFQDDSIIFSETIHENDTYLVEDISRKIRYEKRKKILNQIL